MLDASKFPFISAAQQDQLLDDLLAAAASHEPAIMGASHDDGAQAWERWQQYCKSVGCNVPYLNKFSQFEQNLMFGAFSMAVREGRFTRDCSEPLVEGTVRGAISHVVQAFWELGRQNPTKDSDNMLSILLSRQFRAYRNEDPKQEQQKALPFSVLDELAKREVTELDKAIAQLTISSAFFACCSYEYLKVPRREMKRTKLFCLWNIVFFKYGQLLSAPLDNLEFADSIAVTFEMKKNDQKHDTVIHGRTDNPILCPVLQWACLVNRIWTYPGTMEDTSVCTVWCHDRRDQITSRQIILALWAACAAIGGARLGFEPSKISTHSLRLGAAMEMYLAGVPVNTIMLISRWLSDAFLRYIQKQVKQFLQDFAKKMPTHWLFWTIPDVAPRIVSNEDPWQRNHRDNAKTRRNIGRDTSQWVQLPAFSLYNWSINDMEATINGGGIIFPIAERVGGGENWINNSVPNPTPCAHHVHNFL
jgi:hypothetical protein